MEIDTAFGTVMAGVGTDLLRVASRSSPESASFDLNSQSAWDTFSGGTESLSGVRVTPEKALKFSPWWRGVSLIARDVGRTDLWLHKFNGYSGIVIDEAHDVYYIVCWEPNPLQTANQFRMQLTGHAVNRGNGYAVIERAGSGRPIAIWPLDPYTTHPVRDLSTGVISYIAQDYHGVLYKLPPSDIIHIKGFGFDGLVGYNVSHLANDELGLGIGSRQYVEVYLSNAARPSCVIEVPAGVTEPQIKQLRESFTKLNTKIENMHKVAVLPGGATLKPYSHTAADAQIDQTRSRSLVDVSNWLHIPLRKLGAPSADAGKTEEDNNAIYLNDCLAFWFKAWELELRCKLLTEGQKRGNTHEFQFDRQIWLSTDAKSQAMALRVATGGRPFMVPDEARAKIGLNPLGGDASVLLTPSNFGQGGQLNDPLIDGNGTGQELGTGDGTQDPGMGDVQSNALVIEAVHRATSDAEKRAIKRIAVHAYKAARVMSNFVAWLDSLDADHGQSVRDIFAPIADIAKALGLADDQNKTAREFVAGVRAELLELSGTASAGKLPDAIAAWAKSNGVTL